MRLLYLFLLCSSWQSAFGFWSTILEGLTNIVSYIPVSIEPQDAYLSINQLALKYGYPLEEHTVTTEDGYILILHRIPYGRKRSQPGKVVFLMHGIADCSDSWLLQGPDSSLAYILADEGYDVWMGNARGTKHSIKHVSLNSTMREYWKFSWDEIGLHDLSSMIDYTLNYTNEKSIYYVGYSQGTTTYFALTSMKPEYNEKIKLMFALAPEVFMGNATSPFIRLLSPANSYLQYMISYTDMYSSSEDLLNTVGPFLCNLLLIRCDNLLYSVLGPNNVNEKMWPIILGHTPAGASTFQYIHYGQLVNSERFCRFDYGKKENRKRYGSEIPPDYNLSNVTSEVVMFYAGMDWLSDPRDVKILMNVLPNIKMTYFIKHFGHSDYVYADEAKALIYDNILKHLKEADLKYVD